MSINAMTEALRLTAAGDLAQAAALIQRTLTGKKTQQPPVAPHAGPVIDLRAEKVTVSSKRAPRADASHKPSAGGVAVDRMHSGGAGQMGYRLYRPANARPGAPVVVMLHGCTQSPEDFARGTGMDSLADEQGFIVVYPRQTSSANPQKCWNWFKPGDQHRDAGEPALIAAVTREVLAKEGGDPRRVYVAGLSAGGAAAVIMASEYPDLYAAVGVHSGLPCGVARDLPSALSAMKQGGRARPKRAGRGFVPTITFHGDGDHIVAEGNSRQIVSDAIAGLDTVHRTELQKGRSGGGQAYTRAVSTDAADRIIVEQWTVHGAGHAWSGGNASGSYTDPKGPDASREMLRFFMTHALP